MLDNLNKQLFSMGRRPKAGKFIGLMMVLATGVVMVSHARGSTAYLPTVGPAPLRFEPITTPETTLAWKPLLLTAARPPGNAGVPTPAAETTVTNATNSVAAMAVSAPVTNVINAVSGPMADPGEQKEPELLLIPPIFPVESNQLSGPVTPQILVEYLKPGLGGKNPAGTAVILPVGIDFTPPAPKPAESRAVYKSQ